MKLTAGSPVGLLSKTSHRNSLRRALPPAAAYLILVRSFTRTWTYGPRLTLTSGSRHHVCAIASQPSKTLRMAEEFSTLETQPKSERLTSISVYRVAPSFMRMDSIFQPSSFRQSALTASITSAIVPSTGGNGVCTLSEVELLSEPDARFHQQS
jgi:hypothetical protein